MLGREPVGGGPLCTVGIDFESHRFDFAAPEVIAHRARDRGVENIICRTLLSVLEPGAGFIDVGANYGFVTMVGAHAVGTTGRVLAVEADAEVASVLEDTVRANGLDDVISVSTVEVGRPGSSTPTVDDLLAARPMGRIAAVKIDVDGTESDVLAGMEDLVDEQHPTLVVEVPVARGAADQVLAWVRDRYEHVVGMHGEQVNESDPPPNVFASTEEITIRFRRDRGEDRS